MSSQAPAPSDAPAWLASAETALGLCAASVATAAVLSCADTAVVIRELGLLGLIHAAGLGSGLGLGAALALGLLGMLLGFASKPVRLGGWLILGLALGLGLAVEMAALQRIGGPHHTKAMAALVASLGAGAGLGVLGLLTFGGLDLRRYRVALTAALLVAWVLCLVAERSLAELANYPRPRDFLRLLGLWLPAFALTWWFEDRLARRPRLLVVAVGLGLLLLTLATMSPERHSINSALARRPLSAAALTALRGATDFDGDGFSSAFGGNDCAAFNDAIHPRAREVPGNGLDDNCLGGDAGRPPTPHIEDLPLPTSPSPVDVILISIDSLRPDHMSLYGYDRQTTPKLDAWAKSATVFERAYAPAGWTSMSVPSLLRGTYPRRLKWDQIYETNEYRLFDHPNPSLHENERVMAGFVLPLADERPTISTLLQRRDMTTVAVLDDGNSEFLSKRFGFDRGFDQFHHVDDLPQAQRNDAGTIDLALEQLRPLSQSDRRFLMWVHLYGTHTPDEEHAGTPSFGPPSSVLARYDHEIAYLDEHLGRLLAEIDRIAAERDIVVLICSDHGESVQGKGRLHGLDLSEHIIRVPFIVRAPSLPPGPNQTLTHMVDILPSVLAETRTPGPSDLDGLPLAEVVALGNETRLMISELWRFNARGVVTIDQIAAYDGELKLIIDLLDQTLLLSAQDDLRTPPRNLINERSAAQLQTYIHAYLDEVGDGIAVDR